jgi:hypothetical protein
MASKVKAFMSGGILSAEQTRFFGDAASASVAALSEARAILAVSEPTGEYPGALIPGWFVAGAYVDLGMYPSERIALATSLAAFLES